MSNFVNSIDFNLLIIVLISIIMYFVFLKVFDYIKFNTNINTTQINTCINIFESLMSFIGHMFNDYGLDSNKVNLYSEYIFKGLEYMKKLNDNENVENQITDTIKFIKDIANTNNIIINDSEILVIQDILRLSYYFSVSCESK